MLVGEGLGEGDGADFLWWKRPEVILVRPSCFALALGAGVLVGGA